MYHIMAENHRDAQPRLLHAPFLHHVPEVRVIREINHGPRLGRYSAGHFTEIVLHGIAAQRILVQLHYLLFQCHTGKKVIDPLLDGSGSVLVQWCRVLFYARAGRHGYGSQSGKRNNCRKCLISHCHKCIFVHCNNRA